MKTVLIISYHFLDNREIGSRRANGLYKYLQSSGWKPVIITRALEDGQACHMLSDVYPVPHQHPVLKVKKLIGIPDNKGIISECSERYFPISSASAKHRVQKILIKATEFLAFPDLSSSWADAAIKKAEEVMRTQEIDVIISSFGPSACHIAGSYLSKRYSIPWVADYRDLWSDNQSYCYSFLRRYFESAYENKTVSIADHITTVSGPLARQLEQRFNAIPVTCIPNGFDEIIMKKDENLDDRLSIVYTGRIIPKLQDPEPLFKVISGLLHEGVIGRSEIVLHFYGENDAWLSGLIHKYSVQDITCLHGRVSHSESLQAQQKSQVLLLLTWNDPTQEGIVTGKIYEYFASGRPVLAIGHHPDKEVSRMLTQTDTGVQIISEEDLREYLIRTYREFKTYGKVRYTGIDEEIMRYSHREMAKSFAEILDCCIRQ
ncbi:MAG: hypothetical protein BWY45_03153 [Euryarchaeota archaeon ADurb.Bin294]|nr:MAG: hypothetical protein BWY45_03153 [Euryarchaeota archaeon ADurb.Bin294]